MSTPHQRNMVLTCAGIFALENWDAFVESIEGAGDEPQRELDQMREALTLAVAKSSVQVLAREEALDTVRGFLFNGSPPRAPGSSAGVSEVLAALRERLGSPAASES